MTWLVHEVVMAKGQICETEAGSPPSRDNPLVAEPGDLGTVVHIDEDGFPTVYFDSTGRASLVDHDEIISAGKGWFSSGSPA